MNVPIPQHVGKAPGYRSTQSVRLPDVNAAFDAWGTRSGLLGLLRAYFTVAERSAGRLVRARWHGSQPILVLLWPPIPIVKMGEAVLDLESDRRAIRVDVEGGLVVMPSNETYLAIELNRGPSGIVAQVDLVGYWPRFGQFSMVRRMYELTQLRVHQSVGLRYLRQLRQAWMRPAS